MVSGAGEPAVVGPDGGPAYYIDEQTAYLGHLAAAYDDLLKTRRAQQQRGMGWVADGVAELERKVARDLSRELRKHALWPWLSEFKGLGGVHTARVIATIRDPWRFPGLMCERGHYVSATYGGEACPVVSLDAGDHERGRCLAPVARRPHSGTRSVWHYFGVHVVDGGAARKRKGARCDWDPIGRAALLQPDGLADQIVKHRTPVYRDKYDRKRDQLAPRVVPGSESEAVGGPGNDVGGADSSGASEPGDGLAPNVQGAADLGAVGDCSRGGSLRPFQAHRIAQYVAVKAFLADLLAEWKRVTAEVLP